MNRDQLNRIEILTEDILTRLEENVNEVGIYTGKKLNDVSLDIEGQRAQQANKKYTDLKNKRNQTEADCNKIKVAIQSDPNNPKLQTALNVKKAQYSQVKADASAAWSNKNEQNKIMRYNNSNRSNAPSVNASYEYVSFKELLQEAREIDTDIISEEIKAEDLAKQAIKKQISNVREDKKEKRDQIQKQIDQIAESMDKIEKSTQPDEQKEKLKENLRNRIEQLRTSLENYNEDFSDQIELLQGRLETINRKETAAELTSTNESLSQTEMAKRYNAEQKKEARKEKGNLLSRIFSPSKRKERKVQKILDKIANYKIKISKLERIKSKKGVEYDEKIDDKIFELNEKIKELENILKEMETKSLSESFELYVDNILMEDVDISSIEQEEDKHFDGRYSRVLKYLVHNEREGLTLDDKLIIKRIELEPSIVAYRKELSRAIAANDESKIKKFKNKIISTIDRTEY